MKIIKATEKNIPDILKIEEECFSTPWSERSIAESLSNPDSYFYISFADGNAAGYIGLQIFSGEGYVTNVAVLPEHRKKGIAKALIEKALQNEMEFITLEVRVSNIPAINLYKQFGFEEVGIRPKFYREPEENALLMTRRFSDEIR